MKFLSERGFDLFIRDVCAMANEPRTGTIEFLFRQYVSLIEHMGVGEDADNEEDAYMDCMQVLALTCGRVFAAPKHLRLSDLNVALGKAGLPPASLEPTPKTSANKMPHRLSFAQPVEEVILDEVSTELIIEDPELHIAESYVEGTQMHEANKFLDEVVPVAEFTEEWEVRRRRGANRHIKKLKAVSANKFVIPDSTPRPALNRLAKAAISTRLMDDKSRKRLPSVKVRCAMKPAYLEEVIIGLDRMIYEHGVKSIPHRIINNSLDTVKTGLSRGEFDILLRHCNAVSSWKPRVKMKQAITLLLN